MKKLLLPLALSLTLAAENLPLQKVERYAITKHCIDGKVWYKTYHNLVPKLVYTTSPTPGGGTTTIITHATCK